MQKIMAPFLRSSLRACLLLVLVVSLWGCSSGMTSGLEAFQSNNGRYGFLYPTGWTRIAIKDGPEVVFHDLINSDETLSLVISDLTADVDLENIGSPLEVGDKLMSNLLAPDGGEREAELIEAQSRSSGGHTFYDIEYLIHLSERDRHEIATVVVDRGSLYTFAAGTTESRWNTVEGLFKRVISSFQFSS